MVNKRIFLIVFVLIIMNLLAFSVFGAYGDVTYGGDGAVSIGADGSSGDGIEVTEEIEGETGHLYMKAGLVCHDPERDSSGSSPSVVSSDFSWFDGDADVEDDERETKIGFDFADGWVIDDTVGMDFNPYEWSAYKQDPYEPFITLDLASLGWPNENPRLIRYEGECQAYVVSSHKKYPQQEASSSKEKKGGKYTYEIGTNQDPGPGKQYELADVINRKIQWDANKADCELLGGEWLDDEVENPGDYVHGTKGPYRCCGDDWIWLYNRPLDYDNSIERNNPQIIEKVDNNELCLYSEDNFGSPVEVLGYRTEDANYRCHKVYGSGGNSHSAYDPALTLDEATRLDTNSEGIMADKIDPFYFAGPESSSAETDIGKWSDNDASEAMFCYHQFNSSSENGEQFSWLTIEEAANKSQLICDAYLGYNWTGSQCCMKDLTYNDPGISCITSEIVYVLGSEFSSPEFEEEFAEECELAASRNPACFEGRAVENNSAINTSAGTNEVFNKDGELYFCNRSEGDQIYTEFEHVAKCTIKGADEYPSMCAYKNDSWYNTYEAQSFLGWMDNGSTREQIEEGVHLSTLPDFGNWPSNLNSDIQKKECCYFDHCWNGTKCVSAHERNGLYQIEDNKWGPMMGGINDEKTNYMCDGGEWLERSPKFNWFYDTSPQRTSLCPEAYSCVCSGSETDTYDYSCGEENVNELDCTIEKNFYSKDHYCEPVYDESGNIEDSRWTSRTKLAGLQLKKLAQGQDFVMFCDSKDYSINSPGKLDTNALPYEINNVCVIEFGDKTAMSISFNPDDSENPMDNFLFGSDGLGNGFLNIVSDNLDKNSCDSAEQESDPDQGLYRRCIGNNPKIWVNHKMNSIIYSKDGLDVGGNNLPEYDSSGFSEKIEELKNNIQNSPNSNLPEGSYLLTTASNFDRLYMLKSGGKEAFGFVETRRDPGIRASEGNTPLRNFVAVTYTGFDNVCDKVDFARDRDDVLLYCNEHSGTSYVMGRSRDTHPDYWRDLAPKIRVI